MSPLQCRPQVQRPDQHQFWMNASDPKPIRHVIIILWPAEQLECNQPLQVKRINQVCFPYV